MQIKLLYMYTVINSDDRCTLFILENLEVGYSNARVSADSETKIGCDTRLYFSQIRLLKIKKSLTLGETKDLV